MRRLGLALAVLALATAGCVRSRHPELARATPTVAAAAEAPVAAVVPDEAGLGLVLAEPAEGATVSSPIRVAGTLGDTAGRLAVAQVLSLDEAGREARRGNALLDPIDPDGTYAADVAYTLDVGDQGIVEVVLVEPETGTVTERARVAVVLQAAPAP